jgi:hypothetical protein
MFDDTTIEFLITLAFAIVHAAIWFMAGYVYRNIQLTREIRQVLENLSGLKVKFVDENGQEITSNGQNEIKPVLTLKHEIHDGGHYFYYDDNTFACQGATLEAAAENYQASSRDQTVAEFVHAESKQTYYFIKGQLETVQ